MTWALLMYSCTAQKACARSPCRTRAILHGLRTALHALPCLALARRIWQGQLYSSGLAVSSSTKSKQLSLAASPVPQQNTFFQSHWYSCSKPYRLYSLADLWLVPSGATAVFLLNSIVIVTVAQSSTDNIYWGSFCKLHVLTEEKKKIH